MNTDRTISSISRGEAGKGDKPRKIDWKKYYKNLEDIDWHRPTKEEILKDEVLHNPS